MTTIATDGKTIAADGLVTWSNERIGWNASKILVENGTLYGFTGMTAFKRAAIAWHQAGCEGDPPRMGDGTGDNAWTLLVVRSNGVERFTSAFGKFTEVFAFPCAFGTGQEYAVAALHLGLSPRQSVELAAKLDIYTGGEITVLNIAEVLGKSAEVVPLRG